MLKKELLIIFSLLFSVQVFSQLASRDVQKRNVMLEEFTGRTCVNCPGGHVVANQISEILSGRFFTVAIHAGSFAPTNYPNLNSVEGNAIHDFFGASSYPSGMINRIPYNDNLIMYVNDWYPAANAM